MRFRAIFEVNDAASSAAFATEYEASGLTLPTDSWLNPAKVAATASKHVQGCVHLTVQNGVLEDVVYNTFNYPDETWGQYKPDGIENVYTVENFREGFLYLTGRSDPNAPRRIRKVLGRRNIKALPIP